jgi:hypothetical protein
MRGEIPTLRAVAARKPEWRFVAEWIDDIKSLVASQDRSKLDCLLPEKLVRAALRKSQIRLYLSRDKILRSRRHSFWDGSLSAVKAFDRFGGDAMEDALEKGSVTVAGKLRRKTSP